MSSYASAAAIRREVAELIRPPRRIKPSAAVKEAMKVVSGDGSVKDWSPEATPYMVEPLDCMGSRLYDSVIFVGPARTGKTNALVDGYVAYKIDFDPGDGLIVQISEDKAREFSKKRIGRMLKHSPRLKARMSPRAFDNNVHDITFKAGNYLGIKWPSKNILASSDYQFVLVTDYDRLPDDVDSEGNAFDLASKRTQTFGSTGMTLAESSPGREITDDDWEGPPEDQPHLAPPATGILDLYNSGDRRRWYWQCPEEKCRRWFMPVMENFHLDSASAFCPHCSAQIDPKLKRELNINGRWIPEGCELTTDGELIGERRKTRIASFWMEGPAAAYQSWKSLADKLKAAEESYQQTGSQESLKSRTNTDWGRPYKYRKALKARDSQVLMDRAEQLEKRTIPLGVRFLTASVDIQGGKNRRFVVQVHGHGNKETWVIDRFNIAEDRGPNDDQPPRRINPATQAEDWELLTRDVLNRTYRLSDDSGRRMPIMAMGIDTGGEGKGEESVASKAYEYWRSLIQHGLQKRVYLFKGSSSPNPKRINKTYPDNTGRKNRRSGARGDVPLYILGTNELKDSVVAMMDRDNPGAGYLHTPSWLGRWWFDELTYEARDPVTGKWAKPGQKANEAFDLCVYNLAVYILLKAESINWSKPPLWAEEWDSNMLIIPADAPPEAPFIQPQQPKRRSRRKVATPRI